MGIEYLCRTKYNNFHSTFISVALNVSEGYLRMTMTEKFLSKFIGAVKEQQLWEMKIR